MKVKNRRSGLMVVGAGLLWAGVLLASPATARACPNCKQLIASNSPGQGTSEGGMGKGFNYSIYIMLAVPFLMMGSFGFGLWYVVRQQSGAQSTLALSPEKPMVASGVSNSSIGDTTGRPYPADQC